MDYTIETLDSRPDWHKIKTIRDIINLEITPRYFVFTTSKNKKIKRRTDTWRAPKPLQSVEKKQGWHEVADHTGKAPEHVKAAAKADIKNILRQPMKKEFCDACGRGLNSQTGNKYDPLGDPSLYELQTNKYSGLVCTSCHHEIKKEIQSTQTDKFKKDFRRELTRLAKTNRFDTTIIEFRRWAREDLMPFDQKPLFEQVMGKMDYEEDIGNSSVMLKDIFAFIDIWVEKNISEQEDTSIWYHGTTEGNYKRIRASGEIKVSTPETSQHPGFEHDVGTISLAKYRSMAHFFSAISGMGQKDQVILHIDTRLLDPAFITTRKLINTQDGEMLYKKNIPVSAIVKAEKVYSVGKH